jgi:hypothetical protein
MKIEDKIDQYLMQEEYDADKLARWANTFAKNHGGMTPDDKGWHEVCVDHMEGNVDDAPAYCARVRDVWKQSTYWRGKNKSEKEVESDVKANKNRKLMSKEVKKEIGK